MEQDPLTGQVIGCAIEVHRILGPGLLESTYQQCLARELALNHVNFTLQHPLPVDYKGIHLDCGYRIDILAEDKLILELKSVKEIQGIHQAQLLTYSNCKRGVKKGDWLRARNRSNTRKNGYREVPVPLFHAERPVLDKGERFSPAPIRCSMCRALVSIVPCRACRTRRAKRVKAPSFDW